MRTTTEIYTECWIEKKDLAFCSGYLLPSFKLSLITDLKVIFPNKPNHPQRKGIEYSPPEEAISSSVGPPLSVVSST